MTKTVFFLALFATAHSFAELKVCEMVSQANSYLGSSCRSAAKGKLFNAEAMRFCEDIAHANAYLAIECVKATANKTYSSDDLDDCRSSQNNAYLLNQCLAKAGKNVCK